MDLLFTIFLGIVQGFTEFLPISSSGHLAIFQSFFGVENAEQTNTALEVMLHLGTLLAVFVVYWRDIIILVLEFFAMLKEFFTGKGLQLKNTHRRMVAAIILSIIPLFLVVLIKDSIFDLYRNTLFVGCALLVTGIVLRLPEMMGHAKKTMKELRPTHGLIIGLFQAIATLPGVSRSGMTIAGGMLLGFDRETAVKFSFIMSIPAILGANILELGDLSGQSLGAQEWGIVIAGVAAAFISGIAAMKIIIWLGKKKNFKIFSYYCLIVGIVVIIASLVLK